MMEKRHAYLILAHKNFGQLRKLVELLDDPRNDIFWTDVRILIRQDGTRSAGIRL